MVPPALRVFPDGNLVDGLPPARHLEEKRVGREEERWVKGEGAMFKRGNEGEGRGKYFKISDFGRGRTIR